MIRLALAVGFLAVFGIVAYVLTLLLTNHFNKKNEPKPTVRRNPDFSKAGNHPFEDKPETNLDIDVELEDNSKK